MGLTDFKPEYRIIANNADITAVMRDRFKSLNLTDATGLEADTLEIALADTDPLKPLRKPPKGAELRVEIGYNGQLHKMGLFVVDEVGISGLPGVMTIRARAAPFEKSTGGALHFQTQKTRAWKRNTTINAMVSKIATEHGLKSSVSKSLSSTQLPEFHQTAESDMSFLVRVGQRYDAMVKIAGGKLSFLKRGEQLRADGSPMPTVTINKSDALDYDFLEASRDDVGTVVAFWHSNAHAKRKQVSVGSGDPVKQLRQHYGTEAAAKAAAQAELDKLKRGTSSFSCSVSGNALLSAESSALLKGFHPDIPTTWLITQVTHRLSPGGYSCDVRCTLPND